MHTEKNNWELLKFSSRIYEGSVYGRHVLRNIPSYDLAGPTKGVYYLQPSGFMKREWSFTSFIRNGFGLRHFVITVKV